MKKKHKIILLIVIWYICFYIVYYNAYFRSLNEDRLNILSLGIPSLVVTLIILIPRIVNKLKDMMMNNKFNKIKSISEKYKELLKLNKKYNFYDLGQINRVITEREYSHKGFDRSRASSIILYNIENNEDNIRDFILNAYRNKKMYDNYLKDFNDIKVETSNEVISSIGFSKDKFVKLEKELLEFEKIKDNIYNITIEVIAIYRNNYDKKSRIVTYQELCDIYMQWHNGKKYEETSKRERRYMTDQLRYDVLKRDNFTCKKCGATSKDGAKLHVDHIIPVSKGGKTTLSNLQTLCDRCNIGKGTKNN